MLWDHKLEQARKAMFSLVLVMMKVGKNSFLKFTGKGRYERSNEQIRKDKFSDSKAE
jgi:hypothetical protein